MRILVTGAGLIGTHMAKERILRGDEVRSLISRRGPITSGG